ncbi:MAG: radical SAM protein [Candidatus Gastranaerophilaceae bacterium]|jgi:radical SAM superfamily enzyme YgiQ (UPF0313 family)
MKNNKKIVLINLLNQRPTKPTPRDISETKRGPHFPLGISSIATYIKDRLPDTDIMLLDDQLMDLETIIKKITKFKPDFVGLSPIVSGYEKSLIIAHEAKKIKATVIIGGQYATPMSKQILLNRGIKSNDYCIDIIVSEDGERPFFEIINGKNLSEIKNIAYFKDNEIISNENEISSFRSLKIHKSIINPFDYFAEYQKHHPDSNYKNPFVIQTQKGCFWRQQLKTNCLFCSIMHDKFILKDPKTAWKEINDLVNDFGVDYIWDVSDDFLADKKWFFEFYNLSKKYKNRPSFKIHSRANHLIRDSFVKKVKELKIDQIFVGFESNDDECLKKLNKGTSTKINKKVIELLSKYNIRIEGHFIIGNIGETQESLEKSFKLAEKIINCNENNVIVPAPLTPFPNSVSYKMINEKTSNKYLYCDIIDWIDLKEDWVKYYCNTSQETVNDYYEKFKKLSKNFNALYY